MLVIIILILLGLLIAFPDLQFQLPMLTIKPPASETQELPDEIPSDKAVIVDKTSPIGYAEKHHWAAYSSKPVPKIPYYTHKDVIAPPKAAVEINCPECPNKWE